MSGAANQTFRGSATLTTPSKKKIKRIVISDETIEHSYEFQTRAVGFIIKTNNSANIQFSFTLNESNTDFFTIDGGSVGEFRDINFAGDSLYYRVSKQCIIEIMELYF